jgi:RHS repeat-associated protein
LGTFQAHAACIPEGPTYTVAPSLTPTGNGPSSETLTFHEGTWTTFSGECGTRVANYYYTFYRNFTTTDASGSSTSSASPTYTTVAGDLNQSIAAEARVCDSAGNCTAVCNSTTWCDTIVNTGSYVPRQAPIPGTPSISGTAKAGQTLTAATGTWGGFTPITYTYQWEWSTSSGGTYSNISGATSSTYVVASAYLNDYLKVVVTGTNAAGSATAPSPATGQIAGQAPTAGSVTISGTPQSGQTLTATPSGFNLGTPTATYSYQWMYSTTSGGTYTNISGATSSTYVLAAAYVNDYIKVTATATNTCSSGCGSASATSAATAVVQGVAPTAGSAAISGTVQSGQTLGATPSGFNLGAPAATYSYQWEWSTTSGGTYSNLSSATSATYVVASTYVNDFLKVVITATNTCTSGCGSASATSAATTVVQGIAPTAGTAAISGTAQVGQTLTATPSGFTLGTPAATYGYQWMWSTSSNGTYSDISGATSSTYVVVSSYYNDYLEVVTTATNTCSSGCGSASATSAATSQVGGQAPNAGTASISGTPQSGQTLTATPSGFNLGTPTATYSYQWMYSTTSGGTYTNISGATSSTYVLAAAYVNDYIKVTATATNTCSSGCGSASATSAATTVVQGVAPTAGSAAISGTVEVGQTVTATPSGFNLGAPTATYSYQWMWSTTASGAYSNISGATNSTYVVASAYYNDYLEVVITATNTCSSGCGSVNATSPASTQVLPAAPTGGHVSISGLAMVSNTLTATACSAQSWSPSTPAPSCSYQWQVSATGTGSWTNATGTGNTSASYSVAPADANQYLRVTVTAANPGGSGVANSSAIGQVQSPVGGQLQWGGTPLILTNTYDDQPIVANFTNSTPGQIIYIDFTTGTNCYTWNNVYVYDPSGALVDSSWIGGGQISRQDNNGTFSLASTGNYQIIVYPGSGLAHGSPQCTAEFRLWADSPPDVNAGTIPIDGLTHTFNIPTPGEYGYYTFSGTGGQYVFINSQGISGTNEYAYGNIDVYLPDGSLFESEQVVSGNGFPRSPLPETGTYKVYYEPAMCPCTSDTTGTKGFALDYDPPSSDDTGWMPMNSTSPIHIAQTEGGKQAWRVFKGFAGEQITAGYSGGGDLYTHVYLYQLNASGTAITNTLWSTNDLGGGGQSTTQTLPATGYYLLWLSPDENFYGDWATNSYFTLGSPWAIPQQQEKGCDAAGNGTNNAAFMGDVNTLTGTYATSVTDISLPGLGIPLTFSRCYSSAYASVQGVLGYGWNNSFGAKLAIDGQGNVTLTDENLQQIGYTKQANGSYLSADSTSTLTKLGDGTYQIVKHGGNTYHFDASGNLLSVEDRNGEGLTYSYTSGQLATVTDQEGRTAALQYNADGTLQSVSFSDGRSVSFGYTNGNLTSYTDVRGKTWTYGYDSSHQLTSIQDPLANYPIRNTYANGQVTSQEDANGNTRTFTYGSSSVTYNGVTVNDPQTTTMTDAAGKTWTDSYADNELVSRTDPLGNTTSYTYDSNGNKLTSTDPKGHVTTMTYDSNGNMLSLAPPTSLGYQPQTWTYNSMNEVLTHQDGRGNTTTYNYDANGNLTSVVKPGSLTTTYNLDPNNAELVDSTVDARNQTTNYGYNSLNELTSVTDPDGNKTTYGYDGAGRQTSVTTPRGNVNGCGCVAQYTTTTVYDAAGRKLSVTDGLGNETTYMYDAAGNPQTMVDPLGNTTSCQNTQGCPAQHTTGYAYNNGNQLTSVTRPGSPPTSIVYNSRDLVESRTDALGDKTSYTYNDAGWLKTVVSPDGNVPGANPANFTTTYTYDGDGNRASVVNALGGETDYTYDALDRLTQKVVHGVSAGTETTTNSYDANGNLTQVVDPAGRTTTMTYTPLNQLQTKVDPIGNTTGCQNTQGCPAQHTTTDAYNNDGKLSSVTDPAPMNSETTYGYDNADLLQTTVSPLGNVTGCSCAAQYTTAYGYDQDGNLKTVTDPNQHTTTTLYNADNQPISSTDPMQRQTQWQYDPDGNVVKTIANDQSFTQYGYNALNQLTSVQDARGYTTTYTPNALGELTQMVDPIGDTSTFLYDADGNRYQTEDAIANAASNPALGTTTADFNALDEPTNVSYSDGTHSVGYGYDTQGDVTTRTDATGTINYAYNLDNQVTGTTLGSSGFTYGYDGNGRLNSETYPNGTAATYGYDNNGNLNSVAGGGQTTSYVYDPNNELTSENLANGYTATLAYDNAGQLNSITNAEGGTTLSSYTIAQRDADGEPQTLNATNNGQSWTETYGYDQVGRLASVCYQTNCPNASDPQISWVYDADGNRVSETRANNVVTSYQYNHADQLQSATNGSTVTNYSYNADGEQTAAGTNNSYAWNTAGEMTSATVGGATTNYSYDGAGMRTSSTTGSNTINYSWDEAAGGLPTLASETNGSGGALRTYLYGPSSSPVSMVTPGGAYSYSYDAYGNVADMTGSTGATQWAYQYEPFGLLRSATNVSGNAPTNPFQYAGQYTDTTTGLSDLRARQYDPNTGSFLSMDPASASTTMASSPFAYAADEPLVNSDPTGLSCLGFGSGSCGQDLAAAGHAVYNLVVQPFVQTAQDDWACVSRGTHCAAAALNTGLMLLPVEGLLSKDVALAAADATRGALRDVGTSIGEKVTGGLYRLATEETGNIDLGAFSRNGEEDVATSLTQDVSEAATAADSLSVAGDANPAALGHDSQDVANAAAEEGGEDLYAFGNATEPKGARLSDLGVSSPDETVGPYSPTSAADEIPGASTTTDPAGSGLTGNYHRLPAGTDLPDGLGVHADGSDVGGLGPAGHRTIYPTAPMSYDEFQGLFKGLPWEWAGKI